jgi:hypothetical protein
MALFVFHFGKVTAHSLFFDGVPASSPELLLRVPAWKGTAGNAVGSDGPPVRGAPYSDDWSDIHAAESSPQGRLVWILYGVRP